MQNFRKGIPLPLGEKLFLTRVLCLSLLARLLIVFFPVRKIITRLGVAGADTPVDQDVPVIQLQRVARNINRLKYVFLWKSNCFDQAIVAKHLLNRAGIPSTFYLGMTKKEDGLAAHAWVRAGRYIISGNTGELGRYAKVLSVA